MSKAAVKPAKKSFADFDMDAMDFSTVPANTEFKAAGRFQRLPLADIDPDPAQVRREFDQAEIDALAATIKDRGLLQPIVVAPTSNGTTSSDTASGATARAASLVSTRSTPFWIRPTPNAILASTSFLRTNNAKP
ncbi:ParB/RepB/Spo0J family partition protein [Sphingobium scionense]